MIIVILVLLFLSQQAYSRAIIKNISAYINKYGGASLLGALSSNPPNTNPSANSSVGDNSTNSDSTNSDGTNANSTNSYELTDAAYNSSHANTFSNISFDIVNKAGLAVSDLSVNMAGGLKSGGEAILTGINNAKENISATEENVVNYFSGIKDAVLGKDLGKENSCQCQAPTN